MTRRNQGFTLIEALLALAVCVIIGLAAVQAATAGLRAERMGDARLNAVLAAQTARARLPVLPAAIGESMPDSGLVREQVERDGERWICYCSRSPAPGADVKWTVPETTPDPREKQELPGG